MKHIGLKAVLIAASFLLCSPAFAQDKESQIAKGIEFHNRSRSVEGNESDSLIDNCINTLEPFIKENALACAYYGSALTIKAGQYASKSPMKAYSNLKKGSKLIDKAVKMESKNVHLRILRLENGIDVSRGSPVKRYKIIRDDVDYLLKIVDHFEPEVKAEVYLACGNFYLDSKKDDLAKKYFELAYKSSPDSDFGARAKEMIPQVAAEK